MHIILFLGIKNRFTLELNRTKNLQTKQLLISNSFLKN